MIYLLLLFTVVPAIELYALLQLGSWLGAGATFLLVVTTGVVGSWLAKREGLGVMMELQNELQQGLPPGERVLEGVMVFVGGLLLITPGVFTDLAGFLLIMAPTRRLLAPRVLAWITNNVQVQVTDLHGNPTGFPPGAGMPRGGPPPGAGFPPPPRDLPRREPADGPAHETPFSNKFDDLE